MKTATKGMLIAASAATLLASTALRAGDGSSAATAKIHCAGVNACKGMGNCGGNGHSCASCKGLNTCKGKGWVETTSADCKDKHGKEIPAKVDHAESAAASAAK